MAKPSNLDSEILKIGVLPQTKSRLIEKGYSTKDILKAAINLSAADIDEEIIIPADRPYNNVEMMIDEILNQTEDENDDKPLNRHFKIRLFIIDHCILNLYTA